MRAAIILLFALAGVLTVAVIGLYARWHEPSADLIPAHSPSSIGNQGEAPQGGRALGADDPHQIRDEIAELRARLDGLETVLADLQQVSDRVPLATVETPEAGTEDKFREKHEGTILAILAEESERQALEVKATEIRKLVDAFWKEHQLPKEDRDPVVNILIERGRRTSEIFRRLAPTGEPPAAGDPSRSEWVTAWNELKAWQEAQLLPHLDASQTEELRMFIQGVWERVFMEKRGD